MADKHGANPASVSPTVPVEGSGLAVLDQWLDQRIGDKASLLVVALQFAPQQAEGTAEAAVGLLFGNRLTQTVLPPIAYLHRPEQEREPNTDALLYAARQALEWAPLDAQSIQQTWRVGVDVQRNEALSNVLAAVPLPAKNIKGFTTWIPRWGTRAKRHRGWRLPPQRRPFKAAPGRNSFSAGATALMQGSGARS